MNLINKQARRQMRVKPVLAEFEISAQAVTLDAC
jgi:hypothetical protein